MNVGIAIFVDNEVLIKVGKAADSGPKHDIPLSCILVICHLAGTAIDNVLQ
jgi:hypothetical protein